MAGVFNVPSLGVGTLPATNSTSPCRTEESMIKATGEGVVTAGSGVFAVMVLGSGFAASLAVNLGATLAVGTATPTIDIIGAFSGKGASAKETRETTTIAKAMKAAPSLERDKPLQRDTIQPYSSSTNQSHKITLQSTSIKNGILSLLFNQRNPIVGITLRIVVFWV
jgi:hypothetical protein